MLASKVSRVLFQPFAFWTRTTRAMTTK
jgi:hypothetical protein